MSEPVRIGFPVFADLTLQDLVGPFEVFCRLPGASLHLVAGARDALATRGGFAVTPTATYADCPPLDILCLPGGPGHLGAMENAELLDFLRRQAAGCRYVTSVCTGAMVLAAAGLLEGRRATTHWMSLGRLARFGATPVAERIVVDGNRVTGGGVTAGIDFGLALAAEIAGERHAKAIQLQIEYAPAPPFASGDPRAAEPGLVAAVREGAKGYAALMDEVDARAAARLR
ncbi:MAG: DJ-1/PfpI family protein [Alphaproteobacteria bacterium]|nr:DJ-1/PfpI family protein [Alphaproteobacteria bacterium]